MSLDRVFVELSAARAASLAGVGAADRRALQDMGVIVSGDVARLDEDIELLDEARIRAALAPEVTTWLRELEVFAHIGSTNTELIARRAATGASIDGVVWLAEVQTAGRGRRGRSWLSPFGRNLAVTIALRVDRPLPEIGAASLVVGLAVVEAMAELGLRNAELKWPNDVLLDGRKLSGILIELPEAAEPPEIVVGIGVNVGGAAVVRDHVDQSVADVTEALPRVSRNALAAAVINRVVTRCRQFAALGFAPLRPEFDARHRYHGDRVELLHGNDRITGTVMGVGPDGALRLDCDGKLREFTSGEVSLRS